MYAFIEILFLLIPYRRKRLQWWHQRRCLLVGPLYR